MRRAFFVAVPLFVAVGVFFAALPFSQTAFASGNVLLPSTSGTNNTPLPNLGLGATTDTPQAVTNDTSQKTPPAAAPTASTQTPTQPTITDPSKAKRIPRASLAPAQVPTAKPRETAKQAPALSITTVGETTNLRPGETPTTVIAQPNISAFLERIGKNAPYGLTIQFSPKSYFGANDVQEITKKFGLKSNQISSACFLSVRGMMQTDKKSYIVGGTDSPQIMVRYDGMIKSYTMIGEAHCSVANLPSGAGIISQVGSRYVLPLQQISCPVPNRQATTLTITYDGSATSKCVYD